MEILLDLLAEVKPVEGHLAEIYERLPDATLAEEQGRLRERLLDVASRLIAISQVRGRSEHTLSS